MDATLYLFKMPSHKKQIQNERNKVILKGTEHMLNIRLSTFACVNNWGLATALSTRLKIFYLCLSMHFMAPYWGYFCWWLRCVLLF